LGGGGEFSSGRFSTENVPWGRKFPGSKLVRDNYTLGEFARIPIQNSFYMFCFLFSVSILRTEQLRVIVRGKFSLGLCCLEDISVGRGFVRGGGPDFLASFKKQSEIQFKKQVF
jgi:hypothetical protein